MSSTRKNERLVFFQFVSTSSILTRKWPWIYINGQTIIAFGGFYNRFIYLLS